MQWGKLIRTKIPKGKLKSTLKIINWRGNITGNWTNNEGRTGEVTWNIIGKGWPVWKMKITFGTQKQWERLKTKGWSVCQRWSCPITRIYQSLLTNILGFTWLPPHRREGKGCCLYEVGLGNWGIHVRLKPSEVSTSRSFVWTRKTKQNSKSENMNSCLFHLVPRGVRKKKKEKRLSENLES